MFFITQLIGLAVIYSYAPTIEQIEVNGTLQNKTVYNLPYGMTPEPEETDVFSIIIAFILAILFILLLVKLKAAWFMRGWFFIVVILVLGITLNALLKNFIPYSALVSFLIALPFAFWKIFRKSFIIHNLTELLIYPGIAVVFVPLLKIWSVILLLIIISIYDMWAVWQSGFMQKLVKYHMEETKLFPGFFVPVLSKSQKLKLQAAKKSKSKKQVSLKVGLAILGGGDVVFPIIAMGVVFFTWGLIPALIIIATSTIALGSLFILAKKGKYYPAMPFLTAGIFVGMILAYLIRQAVI